MNNFEMSSQILSDILFKDLPFFISAKNVIGKNEVSPESRSLIYGIVGCELRHHYVLKAIVKEKYKFDPVDEIKFVPLYLLLTNIFYYKKFDNDQIKLNTMKMVGITPKELDAFLKELESREDFIPSNVTNGSLEYLSYRFNTPLWLVKMWDKQFGRNVCFKTLKSNYRSPKITVGFNPRYTNEDNLLKTNKFNKTQIENIFEYVGNGPLRINDEVKKHQVFLEKMPYKDVLNKLELNPLSKAAFFLGSASPIALDYGINFDTHAGMDVIIPDYAEYLNFKRDAGFNKIENVSVFNEQANTIESCLSEKVDLFVLIPRNTNFELLKTSPDFFLRCKNTKMDTLINEQRYSLEEAYNMLNENGTLLYLVPTLNNKETTNLVKDFLLIHRDMSLLEEKLYLPFEETDSLLYAVKMIKTKK